MTKGSLHLKKPWFLRVVTSLVLVALLVPFPAPSAMGAPSSTLGSRTRGLSANIPPGHSDRILRLKFVEGTPTDNLQALLPAEAWQIIQKIDPLFTLPKNKLKELKDKGDERLKKEKGNAAPVLPDLGLWYEVLLAQGTDPEAAIALFQALPCVEMVGPAPLMTEPPVTGNYTSLQGYLGSATAGVDAQYAWTIAGGTGAGITIYDVEYGWIQDHEDLSKALNVQLLLNPGDTALISSKNHGTAVLGEMIADNDGKGVTGIAYGANIKLAPATTTNLGLNPGNAILLALADGLPGDVILVEQQTSVCGLYDYGPSEWESAVFQAIQTATANGLVVVEAAGNGGVNLDRTECASRFNRSSRDSGAIIVGAGQPPASGYDRQRENVPGFWGSSYGSRVDVQGWGSGVMTTGYGDYPDPLAWPEDFCYGLCSYTNTFNGTSSASPMVAASAAIIQAIAIQRNGAPLSPWQVRDLLVQTGSPQLGNTAEHIGPRPDLHQAIAQLPQSAATLTVNTGGSGNDGVCGVTDCTLREAIQAANNDGIATLIELTSGATYTLDAVDNTDATYGANGLPVITSTIIINANGAAIERSSATGILEFRLFQVGSGGALTLNQATLRNGKVTGKPGGALLNLGTAAINASTLTGNSAADGGALANQGTLNLTSSTLSNNSATGSGGAIKDSGTLLVLGSTLAGNSAATGANLSTTGTATLKNTILVKGTSGANCAGTLASGSLSNMADDSSCGTSATVKTDAEINLAALASNGGSTQTMALGSGSAAIDAGNATACKASKSKNTDQRGYDRFADGNSNGVKECDIGAYEYGSTPLPPAPPDVETVPPATRIRLNPTLPDGLNGWYKSAPLVSVSAWDVSGVIEVRCALDPTSPPANYADLPESACAFLGSARVTSDGMHTLYAAAMDLYGNQGAPVFASFQVDATPPAITCPAAGPFLLHSGDQAVGPAGVDASVSGLDEAASTLSGIVTTEAIGTQSLTFTAFDLAGNSADKTCTYNVIYDFGGYYPPVAPVPAINPAAAGSAIPLKFSLAGNQRLDILAAGYPTAQQVECETLKSVGDPSATKPAGKSGLSYDPVTGWYNYVWKTDKAWAGTCRVLAIRLIDGTQHLAYFKFQ
jgi:serine protease